MARTMFSSKQGIKDNGATLASPTANKSYYAALVLSTGSTA
jgi:hypothetical protein